MRGKDVGDFFLVDQSARSDYNLPCSLPLSFIFIALDTISKL